MKIFKFTLTALAVVLALAACRKLPRTIQDIDDPDPAPVEEPAMPGAPQEQHACRVLVTAAASPLSEISFSEGGLYWVIFKTDPAVSGTYTVTDGVYVMDGFGTLRFKGSSGTKASGYDELPDSIVITDEDGNETTYDCTVIKNQDPNVLFRSWKPKALMASAGEGLNITLTGFDLDRLMLQLMAHGVTINVGAGGLIVTNIDISGTGDFTVSYKRMSVVNASAKAKWQDKDNNRFYLDWDDCGLDFLNRDPEEAPVEISYGFDPTEGYLGLGFNFKGKTSDAEIDISCLALFDPKKEEEEKK